ncbi:hypothetical protein E2C01_064945 [Portunus trituberculatus]|uniref:Uncharacterized protein n=1 Tax=Portunus trituberculatus TaxID=210409 RepID=A0A5B7HED8_PORTR|nr:hypothetical protein [Portunus trituberculatus]
MSKMDYFGVFHHFMQRNSELQAKHTIFRSYKKCFKNGLFCVLCTKTQKCRENTIHILKHLIYVF